MKSAFVLVLALVFWSECALAQDKVTEWGYITQLRAGWIEDSMAVFLKVPEVNTGCSATDAGYVTDPKDTGHKLFNATLLGAYFNNKQVQLILRGCAFSKPRIIAVHVKD